jgi:hypothetical protein
MPCPLASLYSTSPGRTLCESKRLLQSMRRVVVKAVGAPHAPIAEAMLSRKVCKSQKVSPAQRPPVHLLRVYPDEKVKMMPVEGEAATAKEPAMKGLFG